MRGRIISIYLLLIALLSFQLVLAEYSIDISGLKNEDYGLGEEINFEVVLLEDNLRIEEDVEITIQDALAKKGVSKTIISNKPASLKIGQDYPSGLWTMIAKYEEAKVERTFTVGANLEVEFILENGELIIRNVGNVRYTKTIEITIGDVKNSYAQNIGIGEEKVLQLISAEGEYDILVTDGTNSLKKENIHLSGGTTGNVVGAIDKELVGYTGFAGIADATKDEGRFLSTEKMPLAMTFIVGVMILGVLVFFERKLTKKKV